MKPLPKNMSFESPKLLLQLLKGFQSAEKIQSIISTMSVHACQCKQRAIQHVRQRNQLINRYKKKKPWRQSPEKNIVSLEKKLQKNVL
jgi:hypothetical protein